MPLWTFWKFSPTIYIQIFEMCHNKKLALNYYSTNYIVGRSADAYAKSITRPRFQQAGYYPGLAVEKLYSVATQTQTLATILNSTTLASRYINLQKQYYLSKGHLAPRTDFIDAVSQNASFYFTNVAPQWQAFNGGNWKYDK